MVSADAESVPCDFCDSECAVVFCRADSARLCLTCDREVHAANTVSSCHNRSLLCDHCATAPATIFCPTPPHRLVLCSSCDFNAHQADDRRHNRRAVDAYTDCPAGAVFAAVLGLGDDKSSFPNKAEEDWAWEVPPVFSWDDLILQPTTTPFHGFQAMGISPPPKQDNSSYCGKREEEIRRQIRKLIISENDVVDCNEENVPVMEFKSLPLPQENLQLGKSDNEYGYAPFFMEVPTSEISSNLTDNQMAISSNPAEEMSQKISSSSSSLATTRTFVGDSLIRDELHDRSSVILRYKQKRKTRRYDKLIRYESRKARADSRVRIKGRFAKKADHRHQLPIIL